MLRQLEILSVQSKLAYAWVELGKAWDERHEIHRRSVKLIEPRLSTPIEQ
ncbi:hypothetical protein BJ917_0302 [Pseudomonas sp. WPR_5_2]|nr:hypothetical protein BJ917_0302 [Pseudomonas sp. WPR_5_2]